MRFLRAVSLALLASAPPSPTLGALGPCTPTQEAAALDADLEELRGLIDSLIEMQRTHELEIARGVLGEAVELCFEGGLAERDDAAACNALAELAALAGQLGEHDAAERLCRAVLVARERLLASDHPELQRARIELALCLFSAGRHDEASVLEDVILEGMVLEAPGVALSPRHAELQVLRSELAHARYRQNDLRGAVALYRRVVQVYERTLPPEHRDLVTAQRNLAVTLYSYGELAAARELGERVLAIFERTLSAGDPDLVVMQQNHAAVLYAQGELEEARELFARVCAQQEQSLGPTHDDVQSSRMNLAATLRGLGDLHGALALEERVLEARARTLPPDHPGLLAIQGNLALSRKALGDLPGARALEEAVLAARERSLPADSPDLWQARINLATTLSVLGDHSAARALEEAALEALERVLAPDHRDVQAARTNLATTLHALGELEAARALFEKVLAVYAETLAPEHREFQVVRINLAQTLRELGELERAVEIEQAVLEFFERTHPPDHRDVQVARSYLAKTLTELGRGAEAHELLEAVLASYARTLDPDHGYTQEARSALALLIALRCASGELDADAANERCDELAQSLLRSQLAAARSIPLTSSVREAEERSKDFPRDLGLLLFLAEGYGELRPIDGLVEGAFLLSETNRGTALAAARSAARARSAPEHARLRTELAAAGAELARLARSGATSDEYHEARIRRELAERELARLSVELTGEAPAFLRMELATLAAQLEKGDALIGYRRFPRLRIEAGAGGGPPFRERRVESLCAFVLRPADAERAARLELVQLGELEGIDAAVRAWREVLGMQHERGVPAATEPHDPLQARGEELRRRIFDPLVDELEDCRRLIVLQDDVLHLVPLDALPASDGELLIGDRWRVELRSAAWELLLDEPAPRAGALVAVGGAAFNSGPLALDDDEDAPSEPVTPEGATELRAATWERSFTPLTWSGLEARELAALHAELFGESAETLVLERRRASIPALAAAAPRARWLHVATHGWFAPESIRSFADFDAADSTRAGVPRRSSDEIVGSMSPMLLCGLALSGANLPVDALGRVPGIVTAEELSTLDLAACELAVLSACDTNVGLRRAGQGVASLQKALHMAGARSAVTSLWKVPDEATRDLMLDFYRRVWVERKPKSLALWEAKKRLRDARDEHGRNVYTTRDWAAWVLTGASD